LDVFNTSITDASSTFRLKKYKSVKKKYTKKNKTLKMCLKSTTHWNQLIKLDWKY